jgi:hypothetical protein
MTRNVVTVQISTGQTAELIQANDFVELEVALPALHGLPERLLHCRCRVDNVQSSGCNTIRLALEVDGMQFRDKNGIMFAPDNNPFVM